MFLSAALISTAGIFVTFYQTPLIQIFFGKERLTDVLLLLLFYRVAADSKSASSLRSFPQVLLNFLFDKLKTFSVIYYADIYFLYN